MAMLAALKHEPGRLSDLERQFRRDQTIGTAPNPVGTEEFAAHMSPTGFQGVSSHTRREAPNARRHGVQRL